MHDLSPDHASAESKGAGLAIDFGGKRIPLKWHRLRRKARDPLFGEAVLADGLKQGASMEVDLRLLRDGAFAVLHDDVLDRETNGTGPVAARTSEEIRALHYADDGAAGARRVLLADDLAERLAAAHPDALLQLDMKDDLAAVGKESVEGLAALFKVHQKNLIISGDSTDLTLALAERLPEMQRGLEPSFRLLDLYRAGRKDALAGQLLDELRGPIRPHLVYLWWELVLPVAAEGIDLIGICHDEGARVDAWTFNLANPEEGFSDGEWRGFSRLLELGADQISTDEAIATERAYMPRLGRTL
ncbi:glycerophosphodiester phosphodiesterase [Chelativorans salis]|uniref:Glycerophosphodiester phosphodiesterase family protein n=1 Tax=Chelativorans salis TaxID=2978478 RepID=A0ABT2LI25_9HYPH|nr:glycerophosphodiester phosphodiesterase family protein [Chelativorans sp. EGI FJ00035]MCT7373944.1 glycerophosphodiester phosphodiesterase family protein [Chelativorans sp. EGI FJ00035]